MNNTKRNVHTAGPLGALMQKGQITRLDEVEDLKVNNNNEIDNQQIVEESQGTFYKTKSGIKFKEDELVFVNTDECEPWKYANRAQEEMGQIDDLILSIKENGQLQPALIRSHPAPHGKIKFEIIFGRRRFLACQKLGVPLMAIIKHITSVQDAIVKQDAENKLRHNVSNYSNALLYKRLLDDKIFSTEKELAKNVGLSASSLNDLMAFTRIPVSVALKIPNIHKLSIIMAIKIVSLANMSSENIILLQEIAPRIGTLITSPAKIEAAITNLKTNGANNNRSSSLSIKSKNGTKLFTLKTSSKGIPTIAISKQLINKLDYEHLCSYLKDYFENSSKTKIVEVV